METKTPIEPLNQVTPFGPSFKQLIEWDPSWVEKYGKVYNNPWTNGILPVKLIELICVGLNASCCNLYAPGTRLHIRAALNAGARREEILFVLKCASALSIHSCSLGAPILLEEMKSLGLNVEKRSEYPPTPACDQMRAIGQWNNAWDPFFELDPLWTDQFFALVVTDIYKSGLFSAKDLELISIAFDAAVNHMYAPGTRRHIKGALKLGATQEEIMEVLKLCVGVGIEACNQGVPILAEELELFQDSHI